MSQITRPEIGAIQMPDGSVVYLKDEFARDLIAKGIQYVVVEQLPRASEETMGRFYLLPYRETQQASANNYQEYITVMDEPEEQDGSNVELDPTYHWECLGERSLDLSGYSLVGHVHHVTTNVTVGDHAYTPAGTVQSQADTVLGHTHAIDFTKKYLHKSSVVQRLSKSTVAVGARLKRLVITTIKGISGTTLASRATAGLPVSVARAGNPVNVPVVQSNQQGNVQVNCTQQDVASGVLGTQTNTQGADTPMWGCVVENGVLKFTWKPLVKTSMVQAVSATTNATETVFGTPAEVIPAVDNGTITPYTFSDVVVPVAAAEATEVATGAVSDEGRGDEVSVGTSQSVELVDGVTSSLDVFSTADAEPNGGEAIVQGSNGNNTGAAGGHTHTVTSNFAGTPATIVHQVVNNSVTTLPED